MAGTLRRDHENVDVLGRLDETEMDIEAVAKGEILAGLERGRDFFFVNLATQLIGHQDHYDVGLHRSLGGIENLEAVLLGFFHRGASRTQSNPNIHSAIAKIQRVRVALASIADDGDFLGPKQTHIGVAIVIHLNSDSYPEALS